MIFRCRQLAPHQIALQVDIAGAPVEVPPLQREQLAGAHPGAQAAHEPGIPIRELATRGVEHEMDFLTRERANFRFGIVGVTEVLSEPQSRVRDQKLIVDGLRQNRAQRPRDPADCRRLQAFCTTGKHQLAAVCATQRLNRSTTEQGQNVTAQIRVVELSRTGFESVAICFKPRARVGVERLRFGRWLELQLTPKKPLAEGAGDTLGGVSVGADALLFAPAVMVDHDPPRATEELNLYAHAALILSPA